MFNDIVSWFYGLICKRKGHEYTPWSQGMMRPGYRMRYCHRCMHVEVMNDNDQ